MVNEKYEHKAVLDEKECKCAYGKYTFGCELECKCKEVKNGTDTVSYTHLTLPTIYSV